MKKKIVSVSVLVVTMIFLLVSQATVLEAKPQPRAAGGEFDDGDFFTPDYNNGGSETFDAGGNRTFNYNCHCASGPGAKSCNGYIILQVDNGSGFADEKSDACNIDTGQTCSANHVKNFDSAGTYTFRVFCDEGSGTDYVQPSNEHVVLTVEDATCVENETKPCPLQAGVCEGTSQTCVNGSWTECDYGSDYEEVEATCDDLDNDCNGWVDDVDKDGDGSSPCGGMGFVNELLLVGMGGDCGNITVFEYHPSTASYKAVWSTDTADTVSCNAGGEIGDVNHDGLNDFVIGRQEETGYTLEVWTYDPVSKDWYQLWEENGFTARTRVGDIGDFDNDGRNEILITDEGDDTIEIWGNDTVNATSFSLNATIKSCTTAVYHKAAGDMDNDGIPEVVSHCRLETTIEIYEYNPGSGDYELVGTATAPLGKSTGPVIDDMECGDVDRDGVDEVVFCGNSGRSHVIDYSGGNYSRVYDSPVTPTGDSFTQTCSIGDLTNDGWPDWFDVSLDGTRVFSYDGYSYENVWNSSVAWSGNSGVGSSFAGDADNDGKVEFVHGTGESPYDVMLWENDTVGAGSFENTHDWSSALYSVNIIIGNLNPYNDDTGVDCNDSDDSIYPGAPEICGDGIDQDCDGEDAVCNCIDSDNDTYYAYDQVSCPTGDDCNDNNASINPGAEEVCGDGVDNDCDDEIDEGCEVCGNDYCAGSALGEDCFTCPDDCLCVGASCSKACCGDGTCSSPFENADKCPVDCS